VRRGYTNDSQEPRKKRSQQLHTDIYEASKVGKPGGIVHVFDGEGNDRVQMSARNFVSDMREYGPRTPSYDESPPAI
jgi:hypothetical protein